MFYNFFTLIMCVMKRVKCLSLRNEKGSLMLLKKGK